MMHLDTVMTMIDHATFVLYPCIDRHPRSWTITRDDSEAGLRVTHNRSLWDALAEAIGVDAVTVLITDEDIRAAMREQWHRGDRRARQRTRPRTRRPPLHDLPDRTRSRLATRGEI
jgi:arginine deiminase